MRLSLSNLPFLCPSSVTSHTTSDSPTLPPSFFFEVFPTVFVVQKGVPFALGGLPFLSIIVGMALSLATFPRAQAALARIRVPLIDPPAGTPPTAPEASMKVALLGW